MSHTYRLAAQLQALAIDNVDRPVFGTHRIPSPQHGIITTARHRQRNGEHAVLVIARDDATHVLAAAVATAPIGGGIIDSHIAQFRSAALVWKRTITPPAHWWQRSAATIDTAEPAPRDRIGFTATGSAEYFLNHDWIPGSDPRNTHWTLSSWTPAHGLHVLLSGTDIDAATRHAITVETRAASVA
ncbi:hypothetical protein [Mycobacterium aquaticum]|uniref:Uncharacterized protein n=1 Tax=Mycobacterium aquaticum TaxID=1927124 RepID=A0A1X0AGW6_9MYCO|nr:hypothetical protein [Mycobacterium aquaticum]ORA29303.1 hypothetical protein BST13_27360 [Mycobacterium aquaticum]